MKKDQVIYGALAAHLDAVEERAGRAWSKAHPDASSADYTAALPISREGELYYWMHSYSPTDKTGKEVRVKQAIIDGQSGVLFKLAWRAAPDVLAELPDAVRNIDGVTPRMLEAVSAAVRKRAQEVARGALEEAGPCDCSVRPARASSC